MKKTIIIPLVFILLLTFVNATCTCSFTKDPVFTGATQTFVCSCDSITETSKAYTMQWRNQLGAIIHNDTGTTPATINTIFSNSYVMPSGITLINTTLVGTNLEGNDVASVVNPNAIDLNLVNFTSSGAVRVGEMAAIRFKVLDYLNNTVTNAVCAAFLSDSVGGAPVSSKQNGARTYSGVTSFEIDLNPVEFDEGKTYLAEISCSCINGTDRTCWTNESRNIQFARGTAIGVARTGYWLNSTNTITDKSSYTLDDKYVYVCSNVTNPNMDRLPLKINYNIRCDGNNSATDRVIMDSFEEQRGISANTTQNQCAALTLKNIESVKNKINTCYAATDVCVLKDNGECYITYSTTSAFFNFTSDTNEDLPLEGINLVIASFMPFILFLIGLLLVWLGYRSEEESGNFWHIAGGVFWLASSSVMIFDGLITTGIFGIVIGIVAIFIGIGNFVERNKE